MKTKTDLNTTELNFLFELSTLLVQEKEFSIISEKFSALFSACFDIKSIKIILKEEQMVLMRLFDKGENNLCESKSYKKINKKFKNTDEKSFLLNDKIFYISELPENFQKEINVTLLKTDNVIYVPLSSNAGIIGFVRVEFDKMSDKTSLYNFFLSLNIAAYQLSAIISTISLNYQMQTNINFNSAMKNIAKIIESQYEFAYIVPLIGEMIDRFISEHLIYVFMKDKNKKYELVWPASCHDKQVFELLKKIKNKTNYVLSDDKKIGVFPLHSEKGIMGAIVAYSNIEKLLDNEINYILELSKQSSITIQKAEMYAEVLQHAALDALTGLNNRRQFEVRLKQEIATAKRRNHPLCCIMLDVDYFKKINDTYGHVAGDCVLKLLAQLITKELREYDIASRYGGEEFCILLPATALDEASFVAQRLRKAAESFRFDIREAKVPNVDYINLTISIGVSMFDKDMNEPVDLYKKVDKALYDAKKSGRNRVVVNKE